MKRTISNGFMMLLLIITITSCNQKFLNLTPSGEYSETAVWSDPNLIQTFVNNMYWSNFSVPMANRKLSDFCDETRSTWSTTYNFNKSLMSPDGLQEWEGGFGADYTLALRWDPLYKNVRSENIFFSKINSVEVTTNEEKQMIERLKGEAYFNRALTYHILVSLYGGVPLITEAYSLDSEFDLSRNSYEECVNFIVDQLDSASLFLPDSYSSALQGHATKGAALALKSRVLLYAASDLHNPEKNGVVSNGYSRPELLGYTVGDANARWQAAKDAAKAVIDLGIYELNKKDPVPTDNIAQNFINYFTSYSNNEDILLQYVSPAPEFNNLGARGAVVSDPNGYNCWGNQSPLQELVDDYEMEDGTKFDWNNPAHKANPYENREPRFYSTIIYEGRKYRPRPPEFSPIDPFNIIQTGRVYNTTGSLLIGGIDTRDGSVNTANGGYTGYYNRKMTDTTVDAAFFRQDIPVRQFRYAEVILNYAEACANMGENTEALTYTNMIRHRAGLPDLPTLSGDVLIDAIRHERRIELALENIRFWDIRRWLIGNQVVHQTHAIDIRYITDQNPTTYRKSDGSTWGIPTYNVVETPGDLRIWENKDYFFPIMRIEIDKNDKLIQNPGY